MIKDLCFEIIETCLNNCKFCSSNSSKNKNLMISYDDFKRTIDHFIKNGGIKELSFSGGEPFLHPDLKRMVGYAKLFDIKTVIFTSGVVKGTYISDKEKDIILKKRQSMINEIEECEPDNSFLKSCIDKYYENLIKPRNYTSIPKNYLNELKELGLDKIVFDYQAYQFDTDEFIMGRNEQARVSFIDSLYNASTSGLEVDIHFIPMKPNFKEIKDILEVLEIIKVPNISILNFLPQGRGHIYKDELQLNNEELLEFFNILKSAERNYSGNIRIGIPLQEQNQHKCNAGLEKLDIKFDGSILPCPAFKDLTIEECKKFGIRIPNIYHNLDEITIPGYGTRVKPLCKQIYSFRATKK